MKKIFDNLWWIIGIPIIVLIFYAFYEEPTRESFLENLTKSVDLLTFRGDCEGDVVAYTRSGLYKSGNRYSKVNVCENKYDLHTLYHELAHVFWWKHMEDWDKIKWAQIVEGSDKYVTVYAEGDITEDFAETFAFYFIGKNIPDSKKKDFIEYIYDKYYYDINYNN